MALKGWQGTSLLSLCCPTTPVYDTLCRYVLTCTDKFTTSFATEVSPGFQVLLVKIVHYATGFILLTIWPPAPIVCMHGHVGNTFSHKIPIEVCPTSAN